MILHRPPAVNDTARPVPRWASRLAHALPLLLLPSCLWRLPFALHFEMGQVGQPAMPPHWISVPYVLTLSVLTELVALLTLGLVRGWGEVAPSWIPLIGGKPVRPLAAALPALLGGLALTAFFSSIPLGGDRHLTVHGIVESVGYSATAWEILAIVCVAPTAAWGPITIVLALAYWRRRHSETARAGTY
ncbi:hypothetical protein [Amycolatopsis sp. 195334CR]|uniref:hypothetical protein n=1 Tax=Amycolatopsis sp. 195334CR TaxID=2814588 RepID=UPI001A8ED0A0|nr:hypothetical protein [Amycolatopsis sp. 195334CR]MBN6040227.1 hypothetical protein [Amycolatopsis sp. 195334CR]